VNLAATMEGERTCRTMPTHRESTAAEAATRGVPTHPAMRADSTTVSAAAVSTTVSATTVSATTVSAAATRRRNGWSKGDRRAD
jgi:hypothetical protein